MSESHVHACPDGKSFKISKIQEVREQPMVQGIHYTFQVDPEGGADESAVAFDICVRFAPIFCAIASPQQRTELGAHAAALVTNVLDSGRREATDLRITSDGAATVEGNLVGRLFPLTTAE